jgi:hypothetical protein
MVTSIKGNDTSTFGGNIDVIGNVVTDAPTFSAYQSSSQTLTASGYAKVLYQTEEWDTNSNYDTSNSRFTPTVAGYYQINAGVRSVTNGELNVIIYKNGANYKVGSNVNTTSVYESVVSATVYLNGSTDYVEIYAYCSAANSTAGAGYVQYNYFQAFLARAV